MLTLAPTIGAPPAPVTWPLMVVPCACASAGANPNTLAIARKRVNLPVIPIRHLAESETGMGRVAYGESDPARSLPPATMSLHSIGNPRPMRVRVECEAKNPKSPARDLRE